MEWITIILVSIFAIVVLMISIGKLLHCSPKPFTEFQGKHAIITGGSSGLGKALASRLLREGCNVTIIARNLGNLEKAREELLKDKKSPSQRIAVFSCDVTDFNQLTKTASNVISDLGPADLLVCNAGRSLPAYFVTNTVENIENEMKLNYFGTVYTIKAFLPSMIERKKGHICVVSSCAAFVGFIGFTNYTPSKAALKGLCDSLRNELLLYDIGVSGFYPGSIDTEGFKEELKLKPPENRTIEGNSPLSADYCAVSLINGLKKGTFMISPQFYPDTLLRMVGNGMSVRDTPVLDLLLTPILILWTPIGLYLDLDSVVLKSKNKQKKN